MKFRALILLLLLASCTKKQEAPAADQATPDQLIVRGKSIYTLNCIACHNANPKLDGAIGPSINGSSLELIQARVMNASYPAGYKPKRTTSQMVALKHLEKELPALHAFLNAQ